MKILFVYVIIGVIFAFLFRTNNDRPVIAHPGLTILFVAIYPFLLWYYVFRIKNIKYKGKMIWGKK